MVSGILLIVANLTTYAVGIWCIYLILDRKYLKRIDNLEAIVKQLYDKEQVLLFALIGYAGIKITMNENSVSYEYVKYPSQVNETHIIGDKSLFDKDKS